MKYSLGLDIGTSSIGWAVIDLDNKCIHDLGVRIFERPEEPKTGKSLAEPRRIARSTRRRLKRRRQRLNALKLFFVNHKLLSAEEIETALAPESQHDPYEIRNRAATEKVSNQELFIALYHITKRRGYKSNRKSIEEKDTEGSRVLSALSENAQLLVKYPTVAAALQSDSKFEKARRNKRDSYVNSFGRANFLDEVQVILATQRGYGLALSDEDVNRLLFADEAAGEYNGVFSQRPFMTSELIAKMRGKCQFETNESRAPRASYSFELFRLAQNLSHLRIVVGDETRPLTPEEIAKIVAKARSIKTLKYSHIRDELGYKKSDAFSFARGMIRGKVRPDDKSRGEDNKFDELTFFHAIKKALSGNAEEWNKVENDINLLDAIGEVLTINKDDESLRRELNNLGLHENSVNELLKLNFSGFGHLSTKALRLITPHLLRGETYDKAIELAGYDSSQKLSGDKTTLPPLSEADAQALTNPVVKRAISQTIKVVNAVIRKYGPPTRIGVEAASDLAKNFSDRNKIKKSQDENAAYNEHLKKRLTEEFNVTTPTGLQITKFKLYEQQDGKCIYSGRPLNLHQLFADERYGEIDHIIPFSRCGNDSMNNKVLVLTEENQNKRNLTPYEAWGNDEAHWAEFEARVKAISLPFPKKDRLLAKSPPSEEWNIRALNDTRYISKFLRHYLRENLQFAKFEDYTGKQRVITPSGPITSYLRRIWQVGSKNREENNLHHAVDACIIGAVNQGTIQKVSSLNKYYELFRGNSESEITDKVTGEIVRRGDVEQHIADVLPWEDFGKEVRIRTALYQTPRELRNELRSLQSYGEEFREQAKPIFVSRMPQRGGKGATNQDTIRSPKIIEGYEDNKGKNAIARKQRIPLLTLTLKELYDSPVRSTDPRLYEILKARLEVHDNNPQKAFAETVYKPTKSGMPGNPVRNIKIYDTAKSKTGFYINKGKAFVNNGSTIRLDIYMRKNLKGEYEYFCAPIYVHMIHATKAEILPTPNGRSKKEKADFDTIRESDGKIYATHDNGFEKLFSVYPNDYVRVYMSNKIVEGYYVKYNVSDGSLKLVDHTLPSKNDSDLISISPKSATDIQRLDISMLGDNYVWI